VQAQIRATGREAVFFNVKRSDEEKRREVVAWIARSF